MEVSMRYTTILWDLDQTILDFNRSADYALRYSFGRLQLEIDEEKIALYLKINDSYWKRMERGEITKDEVLTGRFRTFFEALGITERTPEEIEEIYQDALGRVFFFQDGADEIIRNLKAEGVKQYIVTNGINRTQANKVHISGLDKLMDGVFVSELIGYAKPRKEFFDAALAALNGASRKDCVLVGDSLTSDMQGGIGAGIAVCWYNPNGLPAPPELAIDYEIRHLNEVPAIVRGEGR